MKHKELIKNLALLFFAMIFAIFIAEVTLRIFYPQTLNFIVLDEETEYRLKENINTELIRNEYQTKVITNSKGLRDREFSYEKDTKTFRIVAIGDSFAFGYGVEAEGSYPKILEVILNNKTNSKVEVINFGVVGYSNENELLQMDEVKRYNPDIIILGFDGQTDLNNNFVSDIYVVEDGKLVKNKVPKITFSLKVRNFLSSKSNLYNLINFIMDNYKSNGNFYNNLNKVQYAVDFGGIIYLKKNPPELEKAFQKTEFLIKSIKDSSEKIGAEFVLLIIPSKEQVDKEKLMHRLRMAGLQEEELDVDKIQRRIIRFSMQNNIKYIDILPELRKKSMNNTYYFEVDGHFNKDGYKLTGEILADWLISNRLVK